MEPKPLPHEHGGNTTGVYVIGTSPRILGRSHKTEAYPPDLGTWVSLLARGSYAYAPPMTRCQGQGGQRRASGAPGHMVTFHMTKGARFGGCTLHFIPNGFFLL
jgi:hypothetical protein